MWKIKINGNKYVDWLVWKAVAKKEKKYRYLKTVSTYIDKKLSFFVKIFYYLKKGTKIIFTFLELNMDSFFFLYLLKESSYILRSQKMKLVALFRTPSSTSSHINTTTNLLFRNCCRQFDLKTFSRISNNIMIASLNTFYAQQHNNNNKKNIFMQFWHLIFFYFSSFEHKFTSYYA